MSLLEKVTARETVKWLLEILEDNELELEALEDRGVVDTSRWEGVGEGIATRTATLIFGCVGDSGTVVLVESRFMNILSRASKDSEGEVVGTSAVS